MAARIFVYIFSAYFFDYFSAFLLNMRQYLIGAVISGL
jgi:hypothetical protein